MIRTIALASTVLFVFANSATVKADLVLGTAGTFTIAAGTTDGPMTVDAMVNSDVTIFGWQTGLLIVPDGGSTGTVTFDAVTQPTSNNYILDTAGYAFGTSFFDRNTPNDIARSLDADNPFQSPAGVSLTSGSKKNIADLTLTASADASGTFGLFAMDEFDPTHNTGFRTFYSVPGPTKVQFANVPGDTLPVRIGTISVPEPSAFLCILVPALALGIWNACRALRRR